MQKIELLAPAKNYEYGVAAINAGADAVYIGIDKFSARSAAGNNLEDIKKLITYSHQFYAKTYVAVNTIIFDEELNYVENLIHNLYNIGADAIIIQDLGILQMNLPPIQIFASTQTNNYDLQRIKFIDSLGINRIILARELSVEQIKEIRKNTGCELETFIFGALCVSLSGQCYMSAASCGRSANRGECSQMCRHSYDLKDEDGNTLVKDKYLLSLKDLNLENYIPQLIDAGISSFKIEGRLKDLNYLVNSVAYFRKKTDEIISNLNSKSVEYSKASSGIIKYNFNADISKTFNRGFTEYFISQPAVSNEMSSLDSPKSLGNYIGKIQKIIGKEITLDTFEKLNNGDGLCYFDSNNSLQGFRVNNVVENKITTLRELKIKVGTMIYRNEDAAFDKIIKNNPTQRKIKVNMSIYQENNIIIISAKDEDGNNAQKNISQNPDMKALSAEIIAKQLTKTGNTVFELNNVNLSPEISIQKSIAEINQIRRDILDDLYSERIKNYPKIILIKNKKEFIGKIETGAMLNISNRLSEKLYQNIICDNEGLEKSPELTGIYEGIPLMTTKYCIKRELNICPKINLNAEKSNILYLKDKSSTYKILTDCKSCLMKIYKHT